MLDLLSFYKLLIIPIIAIVSSQIIKIILEAVNGNFSWKNMGKYGGFPSSHSAFMAALLTVVGYTEGINSTAFAISFVLTAIVIRDALGLRQYLSNHSKVMNLLIKKLPDKEEVDFPHIEERLGHTPIQVATGLAFGFILSWILLKLL